MRRKLGILASAGWTHDAILDLTWEQIDLYAREVRRARVADINLLVGPAVAAQGAKWKGYRLDDDEKKDGPSLRNDEGAAMAALAQHGIPVRVEAAPPKGKA